MLAQSFSVVSHHNNQCSLIPALFLQVSKEATQRRICVSNFSVVEPVLVSYGVRRRRVVWIVRIIQVQPNEMRPRWMRIEPRFRVLHHFHSPALKSSPASLGFSLRRKIVVEVEPAIETGGESLAVQNDSADECRGSVVSLPKQFRQCCVFWHQRNSKVAHSVGAWQKPRQNTRMGRIGDRAGRECLREANSLLCQLIQRRSLDPVVSIAVNVVRAQGIYGDQENVSAGRLVRRMLANCAAPKG